MPSYHFLKILIMKPKSRPSKIVPLALLFSLSACIPHTPEPELTQMEVRVIQTRDFDTTDLKLVMKTMMHVLQDEGYIIKNAVSDLGLLCAEKHLNIEDKTAAFLARCLEGEKARWSKQKIQEISANVSDFGDKVKVRVNFQIKNYDNLGCMMDIIDVKDPVVYQEFFTKVSKGIFLQKEGL